ncbi:MAG: isopeptide-forming domain-containing fimbrial protein [Oscillospiraceae bacterium]|nr:isopeptide-forming domain-containing fimbrial protein [Oscillospiraceae bacterium]
MKNNVAKRVLALAVAFMLAFAMILPAFAEGSTTPSITIGSRGNASAANRTFGVYQIFTGELSDTKNQLANIEWGAQIKDNADLKAAICTAAGVATTSSASDVAKKLAELAATPSTGDELVKKFAEDVMAALLAAGVEADYTINGGETKEVPAGYYLIVDNTSVNNKDMVKSSVMLDVAGPTTINIKTTTPEVDKVIVEDTSEVKGTTAEFGETITFKLKGTLPYNYSDFDSYYYVFHDTLSSGLTFDGESSVSVKINGEGADIGHYTVVTGNSTGDDCNLHIVFTDLKDTSAAYGDTIVVTYTATLNKDANLGDTGNTNGVHLEYSNDYTWDGEGTEPKGKTEEKTVYVYTFGVELDKVDEGNQPLNSAKFKVYKINTDQSKSWLTYNDEGEVVWDPSESNGHEFTTANGGIINIDGLEPGTYWVKETESPKGYDKVADFSFKIEAGADVNGGITDPAPTLSLVTSTNEETVSSATPSEDHEGRFVLSVTDKTATVLPGTGGIGTTIFYTLGTIVLAAALVFLCISKVQKKKAVNN